MSTMEKRPAGSPAGAARETVYCFDFDGVLCDTMDESLITAYNTFFGGKANSVSEIDPDLKDFFYEHRYLVRPAGEYYLLFYAFQKGERVVGKDRFIQLKAALPKEMEDHGERFYLERQRLKKEIKCWECLHRVYPQARDFIEKRTDSFFVVTNKDADSVLNLARHFGFFDRIFQMYSKEISVDKKHLMEKLIADHELNPETHRIVYVDDHEGTLGEMKELPLDLYLASWGYTGKPSSSPFRMLRSLGDLP